MTDNPQPIEAGEPDLRLAAPDGMPEAERLMRSRIYPPVPVATTRPRSGPQFTLASLMTMTFFVAIGLAGRHWMPPTVFAGILGMLTVLVLVWVTVYPPETRATRLAWWGILLAYLTAILSTLIRVSGPPA